MDDHSQNEGLPAQQPVAEEPQLLPNGLPKHADRNPEAKIPGISLTWGDLASMDLEEEEEGRFVRAAAEAKQTVRNPHMIFLAGKPYVHRTVSRRELSQIRTDVASQVEAKAEGAPENLDPQALRGQLMKDTMEEMLVIRCCLYPKYDKISVREEDAGVISSLHDSIVEASGFSQQAMPIRL